MRRHVKDLKAAAKLHGFVLQRITGNGHRRYINPATGEAVSTSSTPSDTFAMRKFVADLKRANRKHVMYTLDKPIPGLAGRLARQPAPVKAAPPGRPVSCAPQGEPVMPTIADLTVASLRAHTETLRGSDRNVICGVLDASSYLDTDRLIDVDFAELAAMFGAARADLAKTTRFGYVAKVRKAAEALIGQTAVQTGEAASATVQIRPAAKKAAPATGERTKGAADELTIFPFPLRTGLTVTLYLPGDLTRAEADRLAQLIQLLPVSR